MSRRKDHKLRSSVQKLRQQLNAAVKDEQLDEKLIAEMLSLTQSPFGFIAWLSPHESKLHEPQAKVTADYFDRVLQSALAGPDTNGLYCEQTGSVALAEIAEIVGPVLQQRVPLIFSSLTTDFQSYAFPSQWPSIEQLLVMPIQEGPTMLGVLGIVNGEESYDIETARRLWPLLSTYVSLRRLRQDDNSPGLIEDINWDLEPHADYRHLFKMFQDPGG